jgi:hypothetical protein
MKKLLLTLLALGMLFLTGCVVIGYTEKADLSEFVFEKRIMDKHYFEHLQVGNKFVLLDTCYILRMQPEFEWHTLLPVFYAEIPDCIQPRADLDAWEYTKEEFRSFEQKGSGSWFYIPPLTFSINRIKEKLPKGSILKIQGFYRSGRYLDFENGASNYILLQDEKSSKEFYLWALSLDDTYNKRHWIKPYHGEEVK